MRSPRLSVACDCGISRTRPASPPAARRVRAKGKAHAILILLIIAVTTALTTNAAPTAEALIARSGLTGGVMAVPRASNQKLLLDLAAQPRWVVYTQADKSDAVLTLRKQAVDAGVLARSLYVGHGGPDQLGLADRSAALLLVTDLKTADLTDANRAEWLRVLAPRRGVAIVGNSDAKRLSAVALKKWAAKISNVKISEEDSGLWVRFGRAAAGGADEWPMRYHDPANRRVSDDTSLTPPLLPQWYALPVHQAYWGSTLVCGGGRSYLIWASREARLPVSMVAADLASGTKLWEHKFSWKKQPEPSWYGAGYFPGRSCLIARDDLLYLVDEDDIAVLDGETGRERSRIAGPQKGGQIKWFTYANGLLALLAGEADVYQPSSLQSRSTNTYGRRLAVCEPAGKTLWEDTEQGDIDERDIAVAGGRIYYYAAAVRVACRDLQSGELIWENSDPEVLRMLSDRVEKGLGALLVSLPALRVTDEAIIIQAAWIKHWLALDPETGRLLWTKPPKKSWGRAFRGLPRNGKWYGDKIFDLRSGEVLEDHRMIPRGGCGPTTSVSGMFVTALGAWYRIDEDRNHLLRKRDLKPACDVGVVVADGIALSPAPQCRCPMILQGARALTSAGQIDPNSAGDTATRFARGPAFGKPVSEFTKVTEADWPTYRHDAARSGATPARLPGNAPAELWKWNPPVEAPTPLLPDIRYGAPYGEIPDHLPTQAVCVGGRAFFAGADGTIRCLDIASGKVQWQYAVGSRFIAPPTIEDGRVFAGALDGWVYCWRAGDGELVWRFRLAPTERRIMWYGHLASTWPVVGGAVVRDGIVYAVAGFARGDGVHAVALNAADGTVVWENHEAGKAPDGGANFGHIALDESRLWFCAATAAPGAFDLKTGKPKLLKQILFAGGDYRGMDIAAMGNGRVLFGGRRLLYSFEDWIRKEKGIGYALYNAEKPLEKGKRVCVGVGLIGNSLFTPLFDDADIVMSRSYKAGPHYQWGGEAAAYKRANLLGQVDKVDIPILPTLVPKNAPWYYGTLIRIPAHKAPNAPANPSGFPENPAWGPLQLNAFTGLLTPEAVLLARLKNWDGKLIGTPGEWVLTAVSRQDGKTLWSVPLPGCPAWNGLSMTRDGRILVSLWNGSVICLGEKSS